MSKTIEREQAPPRTLTPREIYGQLDRYVIGQERAKRAVSIAAYNHVKRIALHHEAKLLRKSNILLIGPTGCGKTHIARNLANILEVPFVVVDATEYTEAGYYGKDVEVMVGELLFKAEHSVEDTQRGIIFIDEIDKLARRSHGARTGAGSRDIGGEGVQQGLLKLLEGREIFVPLNVTQHWSKHDFVLVDTTNILFICAGTFSDLHMYGKGRRMGFGAGSDSPIATRQTLTTRELLEYGMVAELLGRIPILVELAELSVDDLVRVLVEPPDSIFKEYRQILQLDRVELTMTDEALRAIASAAQRKGVGARGLRSLFEEVLEEILFEAPERSGESIDIDRKYVEKRL